MTPLQAPASVAGPSVPSPAAAVAAPHGPLQVLLMALAMGLQNATARRIGVPDLTTTVLTLTLTGLAADSSVAGGSNPRPVRRLLATFTMFVGAAIGTFVIFRLGLAAVLGLTLVVLMGAGLRALGFSRSEEPWTRAN